MFLKDIGSQPLTKSRIAEMAGAAVLGFFSIILGISEVGSLFNGSGMLFGLGGFFVDSLGILAFAIPVYLFYAAFLLGKSEYRPDRIFILNGILFPFLTLAIGFVFLRDFNTWAEQFTLLYWIGKGGFNFFIILLTIIEGILILAFSSLFFSGTSQKKDYQDHEHTDNERLFFEQSDLSDSRESGGISRWFAPIQRSKASSILLSPPMLKQTFPGKSLDEGEETDTYQEDIAFREFRSESMDAEKIDIGNLRLPDIKPLTSVTAIDKLESLSRIAPKPQYENDLIMVNDLREAYREDDLIRQGDEYEMDQEGFLKKANRAAMRQPYDFPDRGAETSRPGRESTPSAWGLYQIPMEGIFNQYPEGQYWIIDQATKNAALILKATLEEFSIQAEVTGIRKGPVITLFEIFPARGVKFSKILNLQDNIALRLSAASVRITAPIPGKLWIEVPNSKRYVVSFGEIIEEELRRRLTGEGKKREVPVVLGRDTTGEVQMGDLVQMSHLLIAGAADSGKSVFVHGLILSILYHLSPGECRLIIIGSKIAELKRYNDIPHLLTPVIADPRRASQVIQYCIFEMERRYACLDSLGVRDIRNYNKRIKERGIAVDHLPYIVVVIDELGDLIAAGKELESTLASLAAMSRVVGIHLVLATQSPTIEVITGLIKAHIPSRIAFLVASKQDSRIIMDTAGAEKLLGKGDMLYAGAEDPFPIRMQGAFVSEEEVERMVEYVKTLGDPDYIDDELFIDE